MGKNSYCLFFSSDRWQKFIVIIYFCHIPPLFDVFLRSEAQVPVTF